jgi:hypothetical protein
MIEIRRMQSSEVEVVAELDSYAYLNNPGAMFLYGGNGEKERKIQEKSRIALYSNNPQETRKSTHISPVKRLSICRLKSDLNGG